MSEFEGRARVVAIARSWIGTPYHHGACIKGRNGGVDCAWFVKAVFEEAGLILPFEVPAYSPQWMLHRNAELYLERVQQHAKETAEPKPGDVVLYRVGRVFAHGAIVVDPGYPTIIHALKESGCVREGLVHEGRLGKRSVAQREVLFFTLW